ncbi:hypothetical protein A2382_00100 [Candidatus Woesebacteria bacterium RIFOXYB1_FULL_38_16]|uniref:Uncharacterized protein n=1 Tax=Candidatus Woesebacteria bacterium RIFOXYB1_FULL_38_16 TaxID=1802538 RepID=A0A1F8CVS3_9BACT|nr:MAG: hypothetical protein A2191_00770 [Candidatus Woesebacteria bacterium RIFOXYA1_FULL_38_9]OGM80176.1 MAG: hypothetical protein A2382_00100 [Candidatus Woesebacteria bacterium RIFOXYB1_FULL_38_16]
MRYEEFLLFAEKGAVEDGSWYSFTKPVLIKKSPVGLIEYWACAMAEHTGHTYCLMVSINRSSGIPRFDSYFYTRKIGGANSTNEWYAYSTEGAEEFLVKYDTLTLQHVLPKLMLILGFILGTEAYVQKEFVLYPSELPGQIRVQGHIIGEDENLVHLTVPVIEEAVHLYPGTGSWFSKDYRTPSGKRFKFLASGKIVLIS